MNERIMELAKQADSYAKAEYEKWTPTDDFSGVPHIRNIFNEKFAELIIQESIEVMMTHDYHGEWLGEKLKQHFGVKE